MNTSTVFKAAHALTKATIQAGDSYSATFAICLKSAYEIAANALTVKEFRALRIAKKTTKNGATALEIMIGSDADALLKDGYAFATLLGKNIGNAYIVTGRGKEFDKVIQGDFNNKYQYVYVTAI